MPRLSLFIDNNHNRLLAEGLSTIDLASGDRVYLGSTATVTVTLKNAAGTQIAGQTWPQALTHIAGSSGNFHCALDADLVLTEGQQGTAEVNIQDATGQLARVHLPFVAVTRRA